MAISADTLHSQQCATMVRGREVAAIPSGAQPATPAVKEQGAQAKEGREQ
jgi:hypothetical protein